jgi:hypothetical protein
MPGHLLKMVAHNRALLKVDGLPHEAKDLSLAKT